MPKTIARTVGDQQDARRLWTSDNTNWIMAPDDAKTGETLTWAGRTYVVIDNSDGKQRVREVR